MLLWRTKKRVIDSLREKFPDEVWRWDSKRNQWLTESGWGVYRCAAWAPQTDWGEETYQIQYYTTEGVRLHGLRYDGKLFRD